MRAAGSYIVLFASSALVVGLGVSWMTGAGGESRYDLRGDEVRQEALRPDRTPGARTRALNDLLSGVRATESGSTTEQAGLGNDPTDRATPAGNDASRPENAPAVEPDTSTASTIAPPEPGRPIAIQIPSIGVDASVVEVGLEDDGSMELPPAAEAGWFRPGPKVGAAAGSAVIAGHVDYRKKPGVFIELRDLKLGDPVLVTDDNGDVHRFAVVERYQIEKELLPIGELFRRDGAATLTLITCGGSFAQRERHYSDNIVIRAAPIAELDRYLLPSNDRAVMRY
jgi:LPXTG-site transpeptidase (sortase) family protein